MKATSKLLTLLLALVMVLTLIPAVARAEEAMPEERFGSAEIPFRVNPVYEGIYEPAPEDIPQIPEPEEYSTQAVTYQTLEQAIATVRTNMKNRAETFTVYVKSTSSDYNAIYSELLYGAMEHTGVGSEGDYLMWHLGGYGGEVSYEISGDYYKYTYTFALTYYTTAAQEQEMTTAVNNLINSLGVKNKTDYEKVCAVYDWMCANITYDYEHVEDSSYKLQFSAYAALVNKTAVCQGYAQLFYRLMLELGVDNRVIVGYAGGPHAWNIVELNNLYYNLDSTWDAGYTDYIWFLNSYWDFGGHERDMEYDTLAFHNEYPLAAESYEPGTTATKDPYICAGYCGTADTEHTNAEWWLGRDGTLIIKGTGETYDFGLNSSERPYYFYWESEITKVVVESGITGLGEYNFYGFTGLKEVSLPSTLKTIGKNAFYMCDNLQTVTCAEGLETIEASAFAYCGSLKTVKLPASLKTIEGGTFTECTSLTAITLPTGLESLGDGAFYDCSGLKSITIPGTAAVGKQAFAYCTALETVTITDGLTEVPSGLFNWCRNLKTVKLPNTVKHIGFQAFEGCEALASITLPANLETIGSYAFGYCNLTSVAIPETVTTIGDHAFTNNSGLKKANLPKGLTTIANGTFANCALEKIEIPAGVTVIGEYAFSGAQVTSLVIPEGVTRIEKGAFSGAKKLTKVTLPSTLDYFNGFSYCTSLTSIVIPEGVTEIGTCAFQESSGLTSVTIPDTVTKIGSTAFNSCTSLKSIALPEGLTEIPRSAFSRCTSLKTVTIPESVTTFGDEAFRYCSALTEIPLPEGVTKVGSSCFADCDSLTEVTMPASVTYVDIRTFSGCDNLEKATVAKLADHMFENCPKLHTVELLDTVTYLGSYAFRFCTSLTALEIPANVTEIRDCCFEGCTGITALTIPASVTKVGYAAFEGCTNLREITFEGDAPQFIWNSFTDVTATVYYPDNNPTWTASVRQNYDGTITWVPYTPECTDHTYDAVVTAPTCQEKGYTTYTCTKCGESYVGDYTDPVDHSYEDGTCIWCGHEVYTIEWKSGTTSLNGTIDLNIYVVISENLMDEEDAFVRFSYAGKKVDIPVSQGQPSVSGGVTRYRFSCEMYAKQVSEQVTIQVMKGDEVIGEALQYSVMQYCMNRINKSTNPDQVALCKALLNYAAAVQTYFGYNTENLANADLAEADMILPDVTLTDYKAEVTGSEPGIRAKSATLMLEAEVFVRVYFVLEEGYDISDFTFTIDGVEVTPAYNEKGWYVESPGIPAKELDNMPEFKVGGITVRYGALSYVQSKLSSSDVNVVNMAKALYAYFVAAEKLLG